MGSARATARLVLVCWCSAATLTWLQSRASSLQRVTRWASWPGAQPNTMQSQRRCYQRRGGSLRAGHTALVWHCTRCLWRWTTKSVGMLMPSVRTRVEVRAPAMVAVMRLRPAARRTRQLVALALSLALPRHRVRRWWRTRRRSQTSRQRSPPNLAASRLSSSPWCLRPMSWPMLAMRGYGTHAYYVATRSRLRCTSRRATCFCGASATRRLTPW
mmetsp:Transcript_59696/g.144208  ORF Transcript_59696/g.144208 Transcript_59696/m.144208 type:complete len:215 (-) Transcript_59696:100-744(-)